VTAEALRKALKEAIRTLPEDRGPAAKRKAVQRWHRAVAHSAFRRQPLLAEQEENLLRNLASGRSLEPERIAPAITPCQNERDFLVFAYFRLWSSFPSTDRPGRRMKFLIRDLGHPKQPLMGICCLSSPVRQLRVRDDWIGWQGAEHRSTRARNLVSVIDLSTCVSMPPYSALTGGKLLAGLMVSDEVRQMYQLRYRDRVTLHQKVKADEFYLMTTSGCYGSNAPLYKGIKSEGRSLYRFIGNSRGYSHFQIDPMLYEQVKAFVRRRRPETAGKFRTWANSKIRVLRMAARELGIPEEDLVFSGHKRAIFAAPMAHNWRSLLLGETRKPEFIGYPAAGIVNYWKQNWLSRRLQSAVVRQAVIGFSPADARISELLEDRYAETGL
jgi:hypothetical protein